MGFDFPGGIFATAAAAVGFPLDLGMEEDLRASGLFPPPLGEGVKKT